MEASLEQIEALIGNYRKALRDYPLSEKEKKECETEIKRLTKLKERLLKENK